MTKINIIKNSENLFFDMEFLVFSGSLNKLKILIIN